LTAAIAGPGEVNSDYTMKMANLLSEAQAFTVGELSPAYQNPGILRDVDFHGHKCADLHKLPFDHVVCTVRPYREVSVLNEVMVPKPKLVVDEGCFKDARRSTTL
jgi:hypothetical protein